MNYKNERRSVGNNVIAFRKYNKYSQTHLSSISGISRNTISNIELGKVAVTMDVLWDLCKALNTHPCFMFSKNKFKYESVNRPEVNVIPINAKVGDCGFFVWNPEGINFYPIRDDEMKLIISMLNSIREDRIINL